MHLQRELDARQRASLGKREAIESTLTDIRLRAAKILQRIEEDDDAPRSLTTRLKELEAEEARLERELSIQRERTVIRLPANYEAVYRTAIAQLEEHLAARGASASKNVIRALIDAVVVHGVDSRGGKHGRGL
ncbi:hypothetical protein [Novosphingobium sp. PP1Y]|uniref:hypothetical protein n=1 Tax=Novosphingobium sp. PP1Y TaxID=702113 RepID=UPI0011D1D066|nr:hypothetical protein [Novosphingobium sp. PP1Y]